MLRAKTPTLASRLIRAKSRTAEINPKNNTLLSPYDNLLVKSFLLYLGDYCQALDDTFGTKTHQKILNDFENHGYEKNLNIFDLVNDLAEFHKFEIGTYNPEQDDVPYPIYNPMLLKNPIPASTLLYDLIVAPFAIMYKNSHSDRVDR